MDTPFLCLKIHLFNKKTGFDDYILAQRLTLLTSSKY